MEKINKLLSVIIILLSMSCSMAQNTGYMGKRVIVNLNTEFSPAWIGPNFSNNPKFQQRWYSFNYTLSPGIEIIAGKNITTGVVYHYLNTKYNMPSREYNRSELYVWSDEPMYDDDLPKLYNSFEPIEAIRQDLKGHGFGIFYKQYIFSDRRAPIGSYIRFQFDGFFYKCPKLHSNLTLMMTDKLFAFKVEFGRDFLLFDRLRLSSGLSFGLPFGGFEGLSSYSNTLLDIFSGERYNKPIYEYARSRILGLYVVAFTVNIGFLTF